MEENEYIEIEAPQEIEEFEEPSILGVSKDWKEPNFFA